MKTWKIYGMEWYIFLFFAVVVLVSIGFGIVPNQLIGAIAVMFTLGIILGEIGEHLPIWNKYFGGGAILTFLVCGLVTYFGKMPEGVIEISKGWMSDYSFLNVFISILVVGSLLGLDRKLLVKSATLYLPDILASLAGACLIIFAALANILNLIPSNLKAACQRCQQFCGSKLIWIQMVGVGITLIDFHEIINALSPSNLTIAVLIVLGCVLGSAVFGWFVGFFPIESAITAGLCMANMGGAGDLAVLGAAKRMNLMSYAQISSRIGGAMVLLIGSLVFQFLG